jgi:hypothetical protein
MPRRLKPPNTLGFCVLTPEVQATIVAVKAERRTARLRHPPASALVPDCGCTSDGQRCAEAHRLRAAYRAQFADAMRDTAPTTSHRGMADARAAYGAHLRQAGVQPGQAHWEDTDDAP